MGFEEAMRRAAKAADSAVHRAMRKYGDGLVTDEDDLTGVLVGNLDAEFSKNIAGVEWSSSILRHRKGVASEEGRIGADVIIHVAVKTKIQTYSKAVLIQAKRHQPGALMSKTEQMDLIGQCDKMLAVTPASFVFNYAMNDMRCGSASKISGSTNRDLYEACTWTSYRFFLELFRSPIGDPRLTSAKVKDLPVPVVLKLAAEGDLVTE
ncbi:hypothetical protein [Agrobacterium sp. 22117]|uniref:hypothetical protein n=1 Tax=Agrobacterium sp. 22117 TaxID=3453880 RepID=UPI003F837C9D